jgi:Ca2+-transporting ATPase
VDPESSKIMERRPRSATEGILTRRNQLMTGWQGLVITVACLGVYLWGEFYSPYHTYQLGQTMLLTTMVLTQLVHSFSYRSRDRSIWSAASLKNRWLVAAFFGSFGAHMLILYVPAISRIFKTVPLGLQDWAAVLVAAAIPIVVIDVTKIVVARRATV